MKMNEIKLIVDGKELASFRLNRKIFDKIWKIAFDNKI